MYRDSRIVESIYLHVLVASRTARAGQESTMAGRLDERFGGQDCSGRATPAAGRTPRELSGAGVGVWLDVRNAVAHETKWPPLPLSTPHHGALLPRKPKDELH